jgi:hypothetical protein
MMPLGIWNVHSANATTHHTLPCAFRTASVPAPLTRVSSRQRGGEVVVHDLRERRGL